LEAEEEPVIYVKVLLRRPCNHWKRFRISRESEMETINLKSWNEDNGHWKDLFAHRELQEVMYRLSDMCPQIPWNTLRNLRLDGFRILSFRSVW